MDDPSRYGPAKSLLGLMQSSGVDVTDQDAVSGFIEGFNELPKQERNRLLPLLGEEAAPLPFPPVHLLPKAELGPRLGLGPALAGPEQAPYQQAASRERIAAGGKRAGGRGSVRRAGRASPSRFRADPQPGGPA
jgi:hypothetical protein